MYCETLEFFQVTSDQGLQVTTWSQRGVFLPRFQCWNPHVSNSHSQSVHVLLCDILWPCTVFYARTLGPEYVTCGYLDPLGLATTLYTLASFSQEGILTLSKPKFNKDNKRQQLAQMRSRKPAPMLGFGIPGWTSTLQDVDFSGTPEKDPLKQ